MLLSQWIDILSEADQNIVCKLGIGDAGSWRGDYSQIAFETVSNISVQTMLEEALDLCGSTHQGYKGGEYVMTDETPINIDKYGECSSGDAMRDLLYKLGDEDAYILSRDELDSVTQWKRMFNRMCRNTT